MAMIRVRNPRHDHQTADEHEKYVWPKQGTRYAVAFHVGGDLSLNTHDAGCLVDKDGGDKNTPYK
jgi:hypothetical protein